MEITVNYLAIVLAAFAAMGIGALWYGPVFGKKWMSLMGFTPESVKSMPLGPMQAMGLGLLTQVVTAYVLAHVIALSANFYGGSGLMNGLLSVSWVWLGFQATLSLGGFLWEGRKINL